MFTQIVEWKEITTWTRKRLVPYMLDQAHSCWLSAPLYSDMQVVESNHPETEHERSNGGRPTTDTWTKRTRLVFSGELLRHILLRGRQGRLHPRLNTRHGRPPVSLGQFRSDREVLDTQSTGMPVSNVWAPVSKITDVRTL